MLGEGVGQNRIIAQKIEKIHLMDSAKGYRRINDDRNILATIALKVNDRKPRGSQDLQSKGHQVYDQVCEPPGCTRQADNPQFIAENILNREFPANKPNEKWLTDVTGF